MYSRPVFLLTKIEIGSMLRSATFCLVAASRLACSASAAALAAALASAVSMASCARASSLAFWASANLASATAKALLARSALTGVVVLSIATAAASRRARAIVNADSDARREEAADFAAAAFSADVSLAIAAALVLAAASLVAIPLISLARSNGLSSRVSGDVTGAGVFATFRTLGLTFSKGFVLCPLASTDTEVSFGTGS